MNHHILRPVLALVVPTLPLLFAPLCAQAASMDADDHSAHQHVMHDPGAGLHSGHQHGSALPAGIMAGHGHARGKWMAGYRYMFAHRSGLLRGSDRLSDAAIMDLPYAAVPRRMEMSMHMLDVMYAPTDRLTLMIMPQHMHMKMTMLPLNSGHGDDHDGGGHGSVAHQHSTSGWGDLQAHAIVALHSDDHSQWIGSLGFSAPMGSVSEKDAAGRLTHYDMQPGSGTWDLLPAITFLKQGTHFTWGAQARAVVRTERRNSSGYRLGNRIETSGWTGWSPTTNLTMTGRLSAFSEGKIRGHYNGPHNHGSPPDFQENYGGLWIEGGLGATLRLLPVERGSFSIGGEVLRPVYENANGVQLGRGTTLHLFASAIF